MTSLEIYQFACLSDNYGVLLHDPETQVTASIDAPDAAAIRAALAEKNWSLSHILTTHHHHDHTGGNLELKQKTGCTIVGPKAEAAKIIVQAQATIQSEKQKAITELKTQVAELSVGIAEKVVRKELANDKEQSALIEKLLKEVTIS